MTRDPVRDHLVVIPTYNTGSRVLDTVAAARAAWAPVWVVVDGSTDGRARGSARWPRGMPGLRVLLLARNGGKGAAVLHALRVAAAKGSRTR